MPPTKAEIQKMNEGLDVGALAGNVAAVPTDKFKFDETKVKAKIQLIEDNVNKVVGRKGNNPHFWLNSDVMPLVNRYLAGERTPELQVAILALPDEPPKLKINLGMTEEEQRRKYAELQREQTIQPVGLLMPKH